MPFSHDAFESFSRFAETTLIVAVRGASLMRDYCHRARQPDASLFIALSIAKGFEAGQRNIVLYCYSLEKPEIGVDIRLPSSQGNAIDMGINGLV